ncbi:MAG: hypothetical protein JO360_08860 [Acidobacteria bacterium]|nr:hypothetical protein [Acidobacteriota bacterium]
MEKKILMNLSRKIVCLALALVMTCGASALAQSTSNTTGKLNVWTTASVVRDGRNSSSFNVMRVAKQKGFDRVVFEFDGEVPNYSVHFEKPPIEDYSGENLRMSGRAFVVVQFFTISYPDENDAAKKIVDLPRNKVRAGLVTEIRNSEWFEGYLSFAIGLRKRTPFRVQQLSNPSRLVIDFKN